MNLRVIALGDFTVSGTEANPKPYGEGWATYTLTDPTITIKGKVQEINFIAVKATSITLENCSDLVRERPHGSRPIQSDSVKHIGLLYELYKNSLSEELSSPDTLNLLRESTSDLRPNRLPQFGKHHLLSQPNLRTQTGKS